jgi:hypothetical protein
VVLFFAAGCWPGGSSVESLRDAARSLVPPGSRVVEEVEGDCVELARSPSCVHIFYVAEALPLANRVRATEKSGWETTSHEFLAGSADLRFRRVWGAFIAFRPLTRGISEGLRFERLTQARLLALWELHRPKV